MLASPILKLRAGAGYGSTFAERGPPREEPDRALSSFARFEVANDNPGSLEQDLATLLMAAQRELRSVAMHLAPEFVVRTLRQLRNLLDPAEWDEEDARLSLPSFRSFVRAMVVLQPLERPMLAISNNGNVVAMWGAGDARLSLEHLDGDELRWFVRQNVNGHHDTAAGVTNIALVEGIIFAHSVRPLLDGAG
jgi:hypothetical protein